MEYATKLNIKPVDNVDATGRKNDGSDASRPLLWRKQGSEGAAPEFLTMRQINYLERVPH
ncbi:hypothetical protein [Bradyrhizobium sp.]|uniref:hypothetical protein n=1 Tax=Bradyrhizobium sp. TaxID=376 RepID=UPI0027303376|nr:hypothetical protein [Bradyrhizobium sp.]MDP1865090.1 hypothetical protein [Bradyrhizobium sp.]MDP3078444.1 hypothetical protein [Bradyrhizobium sp.]